MKVFADTHLLIDYLVNGDKQATLAINHIVESGHQPVISTHTVAILNYFIDKKYKNPAKKKAIAAEITRLFEISTPAVADVPNMLQQHDWEDAFQYFSAKQAKCKLIVTDNIHDYSFSEIALMNISTFNSMFL